MKKAVVLYSGGLDSTTVLYWAIQKGYRVTALTLDYGQLHRKEVHLAVREMKRMKIRHYLLKVAFPWKGSALLDKKISIPVDREEKQMTSEIPATYVPARNTVFLAHAASCAEATGAEAICIGANAIDYSGYPDCRPEFMKSFERVMDTGTKSGVQGKKIKILTPLIRLSKASIIRLGKSLGVRYERTWSCYQGKSKPCLVCDSCKLRLKGFHEAGLKDPLVKV